MYSSSFGVTLIALTMISTLVILAVTSNIVLSLGMVGALSIVRFRTAIKEPLDIAFLFWSIASGIVLAAGMIPLAIIGSVFISIILVLFANKKSYVNPFILVLKYSENSEEDELYEYIKNNVEKSTIKSKIANNSILETNFEIRLKNENSKFITELSKMKGVTNVALVSYNGDYMG